MNPLVLIILSVVFRIVSQLWMKKGINALGTIHFDIRKIPLTLFRLVFQRDVFLGFAVYGLALFFWVFALSRVELNYAFPLTSVSFIVTPVGAAYFFGERISMNRKIGIGMIGFGLILTTLS